MKTHNTGLLRKVLIVLTMGFPDQRFLGAFYIPLLFRLIPQQFHQTLALNLIAISPHYFGEFHPTPALPSRNAFLEAEHQRMTTSRQRLISEVVEPHLKAGMTVLDHGCGPGYLACAVAPLCHQVIALDISQGVLACARAINNKPNITYLLETGTTLSQLTPGTIDLIYSLAVMLHVKDEVCRAILHQFFQLLKPEGKVICEFLVANAVSKPQTEPGTSIAARIKDKYTLRVISRPLEQIREFIESAGLELTDFSENQPEEQNGYSTFILTKPVHPSAKSASQAIPHADSHVSVS